MEFERILVEKAENVATLILNRPEKFNAMDVIFLREFRQCLEELSVDSDTRVILITGAGRSFCPGLDVETVGQASADPEGSGMGRGSLSQPFALPQNVPDSLRACPKPTIAAINGAAAGLGLALTCFCDYRIASEKATFTSGLIKLGLAAELGLTYALPRLIGLPPALEFLSTGETRDAIWAYNTGFVRQIVPHDELMKASCALAALLAGMPPVALQMLKHLVYESMDSTYERQIRAEAYAGLILSQTEDHREGIRAFLEKRRPLFKGI